LIQDPTELGKSIQNLVLAREKAARGALSPEYNSVRDQASNMGAILPAQETQDLLGTAFDLFMKDPWGRQSDLLKLVKQQSDKFKDKTKSGLYDAKKRLGDVKGIGVFEFGMEDIVRNPIISEILNRYE
jgi:hypothetical protein